MIGIQQLTQMYGTKLVLDHVDLFIAKNEVCALIGRNGAGKSTLINCLLGLLPVKKGKITINDKLASGKKRPLGDIAYLPEKFALYPTLTGMENMIFFAQVSGKKADEERIAQILQSVRLWDDRNAPVKSYSKGMLQRLGLAITLYQDAPILILDEPTSGLDPMGRREVLEVLRSLHDKTILLSSHHMDEIKQICSHVAFLNEHKLEKYTVEDFMKQQNLMEGIPS
ncbi:ABC transporter ATP-binding protein [Bacillus benzoevorans]|uniref:ABC-2 type transport system ATP-binding protein n=1 Tax=Bacillus benzoevorans TaxID=1456 RepID=A0A7X0HRB9_9BACI|nr:ABC transporter ATP-binding protein [Bacillus benzoevorans]MBB6445508.1 ABC-2 type transport system ATP-binding protein [Bacillus benzoevorans]